MREKETVSVVESTNGTNAQMVDFVASDVKVFGFWVKSHHLVHHCSNEWPRVIVERTKSLKRRLSALRVKKSSDLRQRRHFSDVSEGFEFESELNKDFYKVLTNR